MDDLLKQARDIIGNTGRELLGLIEGRVEAATRETLETISAFLGTELPDSVEAAATIDRIERYADAWAGLVPQAPEMRASWPSAGRATEKKSPSGGPRNRLTLATKSE